MITIASNCILGIVVFRIPHSDGNVQTRVSLNFSGSILEADERGRLFDGKTQSLDLTGVPIARRYQTVREC